VDAQTNSYFYPPFKVQEYLKVPPALTLKIFAHRLSTYMVARRTNNTITRKQEQSRPDFLQKKKNIH
jgi:hypothetical protein